jgi:hypothetical protein
MKDIFGKVVRPGGEKGRARGFTYFVQPSLKPGNAAKNHMYADFFYWHRSGHLALS